jgi:ABC-2 type transport system permease protein
MWWSFYSVFRKEFLHIIRDSGTLRLAISLPVMQLLLFGFIDQTVHDVKTVIVDQDRSAESRLLMDQLTASKTFKITRVTASPNEARELIRAGTVRVGVVIPPDYRDALIRGELAQILVLIDGSDSTVSAQALASINGLVAQKNLVKAEEIGSPRGVAAQPILMFNPEGRTANYLIPGLAAVVIFIVAVALTSTAIVREREKGTLEQLLVTPVHPLGLMLGKLGPYLFVALLEFAMVLTLMRFVFSVPIAGSVFLLFTVALVYLFSLLSLGLLISTRAKTQTEALQMSQMSMLPSIFLSGYIFPFEGLPVVLKGIGLILPVTHMIAIMRGVVLRNAGIADLWPHMAALAGTSLVLVFLASRSIHKVTE